MKYAVTALYVLAALATIPTFENGWQGLPVTLLLSGGTLAIAFGIQGRQAKRKHGWP